MSVFKPVLNILLRKYLPVIARRAGRQGLFLDKMDWKIEYELWEKEFSNYEEDECKSLEKAFKKILDNRKGIDKMPSPGTIKAIIAGDNPIISKTIGKNNRTHNPEYMKLYNIWHDIFVKYLSEEDNDKKLELKIVMDKAAINMRDFNRGKGVI